MGNCNPSHTLHFDALIHVATDCGRSVAFCRCDLDHAGRKHRALVSSECYENELASYIDDHALVTLLLSLTTLCLQFTSTALLSNVGLAFLPIETSGSKIFTVPSPMDRHIHHSSQLSVPTWRQHRQDTRPLLNGLRLTLHLFDMENMCPIIRRHKGYRNCHACVPSIQGLGHTQPLD
jgi:hypothetical protein